MNTSGQWTESESPLQQEYFESFFQKHIGGAVWYRLNFLTMTGPVSYALEVSARYYTGQEGFKGHIAAVRIPLEQRKVTANGQEQISYDVSSNMLEQYAEKLALMVAEDLKPREG